MKKRLPPLLWFALFAGVMWAAAPWLPGVSVPGRVRYAGVSILIIWALWLATGASLALKRGHTTINPYHPERAAILVTEGVFRQTRNPIYAGFALCLCAQVVWLQSPLLFFGVAAFIQVITVLQIIPEEQALTKRFPQQYPAYQQKVRRWL